MSVCILIGGYGLVSTDGGRYDVEVSSRVRRPVYWGRGGRGGAAPASGTSGTNDDGSCAVRRCSWFRKGVMDVSPHPYDEDTADKLEVS